MRKVFLTLISCIRNESHYVKEWLAFYHSQGVERFAICLHKTNDRTEQCIKELPFAHKIYICRSNSDGSVQNSIKEQLIREYCAGKTEWYLFCDADEFIWHKTEYDLKKVLAGYKECGGLAVYWKLFGTNNHSIRPDKLAVESFTKWTTYRQDHFKCFTRADQLLAVFSPHSDLTYLPLIDSEGNPVKDTAVKGWRNEDHIPTYNEMQCNHYYTRSLEDWVQRRKRRGIFTEQFDPEVISAYGTNHLIDIEHRCTQYEDAIAQRFANKIGENINGH